jgi:hypothetical protein
MNLFELFDPDVMVTKLVAVTDQLKSDIEDKKTNPEMSTTDFLKYLKKYDIIVDRTDLYDMIKKMPLKNLISNIQGEKIEWRGNEEAPEETPDEKSKETVAKMAQQAAK